MKTKMDFEEKGMGYNQDDLVFANRNRSYGAYELRKKYNRRLFIGFIFAFFIVGTGIGIPAISAYYAKNNQRTLPPKDDTHVLFKPDEIEPVQPPPPPVIEVDVAQIRVRPPVIVDTVLNDSDLPLMADDAKLLLNDEVPPLIALAPVNDGTKNIIDDPDKEIYYTVQEPATFQGGDIKNFTNWLLANINFPTEAINAGVQGKVILQFTVNTKGIVGDVKLLRGVHPSLNNECVRVLTSSPKWEPAKQNGQRVKQLFSLPLVFVLQ